MVKRKVTVTIDEDLVEVIRSQGADNLSSVVNDALLAHADRIGRSAALRDQLDHWDAQLGPVSAKASKQARDAFDQLDGVRGEDQGAA